jgi:hypothetical protein
VRGFEIANKPIDRCREDVVVITGDHMAGVGDIDHA